jgi:hypothetical protein
MRIPACKLNFSKHDGVIVLYSYQFTFKYSSLISPIKVDGITFSLPQIVPPNNGARINLMQ